MQEKVYIVAETGIDQYSIHGVYKTYSGALKGWNELRVNMIGEYERRIQYHEQNDEDDMLWWVDVLKKRMEHLNWDDPKTIAQRCPSASEDVPIIREYDLNG